MKFKFIAIISIFICLLILIPSSFAVDNETNNNGGNVLTADYYFNANIENDTGNGTADNPYKNLNYYNLKDDSIIHLASGTYDFNGHKTIRNVTIIGENASTTFVKNAMFISSTSLAIYNVTFVSSTIISKVNFTAVNTVFRDSSSTNGGAIRSNGNVNLDSCSFINNTAKFGGAIYIKGGVLNISNSEFINNSATLFGGAIISISSNSSLSNMSFKNNKAGYYGGAIYSLYSLFNLTNSYLDNNSAKEGGALFIDDADSCHIYLNTFSNNNASTVGAIYSISNNVVSSLENGNTFINNFGYFANDVFETDTPNMTISNGEYILVYCNSTYNGQLPSSYNLKTLGYVTPVKDQKTGGNCWAFATLAALESCILKASNVTYDLSEENMKNLMSYYSDYGWDMKPNNGGFDDMGVGYLVSWLGPVNESDDAYNPSGFLSPVLNSFYHIQNVVYLSRSSYTDNNAIKMAIMNYGAVATSIHWNGSYVNNNNHYYYGSSGANHAITIVGWDDNYSKYNFKTAPPGDGAWIIKNSWGTDSGDKGYYYVSYYDTKCAQPGRVDITYTFILNDTIKYDKNYQYDIPGKTDYFLNSSSTIWYKNKFTATDYEYLAAVSTYFKRVTNYTFYIYVNNVLKHTQSGISNMGYYTLNLNQFVSLSKGDIFEVVFKITVDGEAEFPISEAVSLNKLLYSKNTSFLSYDGKNWVDIFNLTWNYSSHTYTSQVACIKAFTVLNLINTTTNLIVNISGDNFYIAANVLNQYNRPVTGGNVTFNINGVEYEVPVVNGFAVLNLSKLPWEINISAIYENNGYISSDDNDNFVINFLNTTISLMSNHYNPVNITFTVLDQNGDLVNAGNVTIKIDSKEYTVKVVNGTASLNHVFETFGLHNVSAIYNGAYAYNSSSISSNVTVYSSIISQDEVKTLNSQYIFQLFDRYSVPLNNAKVSVIINSKYYHVVTDGNGIARLTIGLAPNNYVIHIINPATGEIKTQNIKVVARITENAYLKMYYGEGKYYKVKVADDNGKVAAGVKVKFSINGRTYTKKTNSNGYASLKISINPGKYTIKTTYKGYSVSNTINVKTTIITKDQSVKKGETLKFKVKLLNKKGKILKKKNVKINFKGKTYKVKTNSKGIATLKIKIKYKIGKYNIKTKYGSLTVKNKIKIKK